MQLNHTCFAGRLTRDPEIRQLGQGIAAKLGLAVNRTFTSNGERQERTSFITVECYARNAELAQNHCHTGQELVIEGYLEQDTWEDKQGNKRSLLKVVARNIQFVGPKQDAPGQQRTPSPQGHSDGGIDSEPPF